jgi:hypothetical protein
MGTERASTELCREDGPNSRVVWLSIDAAGLRLETQDRGPRVEHIFGDTDYAFATHVPRAAFDDLLAALIQEHLSNDPQATDKLRDLCQRRGVDHSWSTFS